MRLINRTSDVVWVGLYDANERVISTSMTFFPWGARRKLGPNSSLDVDTGARRKVKAVFWNAALLGNTLANPRVMFPTAASLAKDSHAYYAYNKAGEPTPMDKTERVIVLMLENRSFDNILGWLYDDKKNAPPRNIPAQAKPYYLGLTSPDGKSGGFWNTRDALKHDTAKPDERVYVRRGCQTYTKPNPNPREIFPQFVEQMFGTENPSEGAVPNMWGFLQSYTKVKNNKDVNGIMECYTPDQLPFTSALAKAYGVCDRWFASVPCETWPNRSFLHAATSFGRLNNCNDRDTEDCIPNFVAYAGKRTIFDVFDEEQVAYKIFKEPGILPPILPWQFFTIAQKFDRPVAELSALKSYLNDANGPSYLFVEPEYCWPGVANGTDQHPPADVRQTETLLRTIYNTMRDSNVWSKTLLLITYDEHGGCYDHVEPPAGPKPDTYQPQFPATFDPFTRYGPRVPAILISPYIESGTVFRGPAGTEFDHTSVLATLREWIYGAGDKRDILGDNERLRKAPSMWSVLTRSDARTDRIQMPMKTAAPLPISESVTVGTLSTEAAYLRAGVEAERIVTEEIRLSAGSDPDIDWDERYRQLCSEKYEELLENPQLLTEGLYAGAAQN